MTLLSVVITLIVLGPFTLIVPSYLYIISFLFYKREMEALLHLWLPPHCCGTVLYFSALQLYNTLLRKLQ